MGSKKQNPNRVEMGSGESPMAHNPFAGLAKIDGLPAPEPELRGAEGQEPPGKGCPAWGVARTRKGGFDMSIERRPGGKTVTVLHRVSGDRSNLLRELKRMCGAGGTIRGDVLEIQGDHRETIERYLSQHRVGEIPTD